MWRRLRGPCQLLALAALCAALVSAFTCGDYPAEAAVLEQEVEDQAEPCPPPDGPTVENVPRSPGAKAKYEVKFCNGEIAGALQNGQVPPEPLALFPSQDGIVFRLSPDVQLPESITAKEVDVHFSRGEEFGSGEAVRVEISEHDHRGGFLDVTVYPEVERSGREVPIPQGALVTVVFTEKAGIRNPEQGGTFLWQVGTTKDLGFKDAMHPDPLVREAFDQVEKHVVGGVDTHFENGLLVDWEVSLEPEGARRGDRVVATGRGFGVRSTVTFWRDENFNGLDDPGEALLCRVNADNQGEAECSFILGNPPFAPGFGECRFVVPEVTESRESSRAVENADCNFVNARDADGHSSIVILEPAPDNTDLENTVEDAFQVLRLRATVRTGVYSRPHRQLNFELLDLPDSSMLSSVTVGGFPVFSEGEEYLPSVSALGEAVFQADVPGKVLPGRQRVRVLYRLTDDGPLQEDHADVDLDNSLVVGLSSTSLAPNHRVRITVDGFTGSRISSVRISGVPLDLSGLVTYGEDGLELDSGGRWAGSFTLPLTRATLRGGVALLVVEDDQGTEGHVEIELSHRSLVLQPEDARPGQQVTISGAGFPVTSPRSPPVPVKVSYQYVGGESSLTVTPDHGGSFDASLNIPLSVPIPSSNRLQATFSDDLGHDIRTSVFHVISPATASVSPESGVPGSTVVVKGSGFRRFAPVQSVRLAQFDLTPSPAPHTDAHGNFEVELLVPQLDPGVESVVVVSSGVVASGDFSVGVPPNEVGSLTPAAEAFADLGDMLEVCFHFDDREKTWTFYEPDWPEDSDLEFLVAGEAYWIKVREDTSIILNGKTRSLTCEDGVCWNVMVW